MFGALLNHPFDTAIQIGSNTYRAVTTVNKWGPDAIGNFLNVLGSGDTEAIGHQVAGFVFLAVPGGGELKAAKAAEEFLGNCQDRGGRPKAGQGGCGCQAAYCLQKVEAILQGDLEIIVTNANATKLAGRSAKALNGAERTQVAEMLLKNIEGLSEEEQQAFLKAYKERAARSSSTIDARRVREIRLRAHANEKEFTVPWSNGRNHVRIVDDWIKESGIIQEATTIEWTAADVNKVGTGRVRSGQPETRSS